MDQLHTRCIVFVIAVMIVVPTRLLKTTGKGQALAPISHHWAQSVLQLSRGQPTAQGVSEMFHFEAMKSCKTRIWCDSCIKPFTATVQYCMRNAWTTHRLLNGIVVKRQLLTLHVVCQWDCTVSGCGHHPAPQLWAIVWSGERMWSKNLNIPKMPRRRPQLLWTMLWSAVMWSDHAPRWTLHECISPTKNINQVSYAAVQNEPTSNFDSNHQPTDNLIIREMQTVTHFKAKAWVQVFNIAAVPLLLTCWLSCFSNQTWAWMLSQLCCLHTLKAYVRPYSIEESPRDVSTLDTQCHTQTKKILR